MSNNPQKVLFADLFRLNTCIKDETKAAAKSIGELLNVEDWETVTRYAEEISNCAERIVRLASAMRENVDVFLGDGPYGDQEANMRPLELMARRESE